MTLRDDYVRTLEEENEALRERVRQLEDIAGASFESPPVMGLTRPQSAIFGMLLKGRLITTAAAMTAIYGSQPGDAPDEDIIKVFVCQLRAKLEPFGIEVETQWGQGYYMTADNKARCSQLLNQVDAA